MVLPAVFHCVLSYGFPLRCMTEESLAHLLILKHFKNLLQ